MRGENFSAQFWNVTNVSLRSFVNVMEANVSISMKLLTVWKLPLQTLTARFLSKFSL